jgi:hypothetical protein
MIRPRDAGRFPSARVAGVDQQRRTIREGNKGRVPATRRDLMDVEQTRVPSRKRLPNDWIPDLRVRDERRREEEHGARERDKNRRTAESHAPNLGRSTEFTPSACRLDWSQFANRSDSSTTDSPDGPNP